MRASRTSAAALLAGCLAAGACAAAGDPARGEDTFKVECAECHSARKGKSKKGASMFGIVGRPAATVPGEVYSEALKATGWTWNEERLRHYLGGPVSRTNPGGKMKYEGLKDPQAMDDLLAYLASLR